MKDFVSKVTFGFLMAQLLPGAVVVFALTCLYQDLRAPNIAVGQLLLNCTQGWFHSSLATILFLFVATAIGMLIHGLNWTILALLEHKYECVRGDIPWHKLPLWLQIIVSPYAMLIEIWWLIVAPNLVCLIMDENVPRIRADEMPQFTFLQEFYLHFGQFYAHMAYAFLIAVLCSLICLIANVGWARLGVSVSLYFCTSVFFLLGRIQLGSLFEAETILKNKSSTDKATPTAAGQ